MTVATATVGLSPLASWAVIGFVVILAASLTWLILLLAAWLTGTLPPEHDNAPAALDGHRSVSTDSPKETAR